MPRPSKRRQIGFSPLHRAFGPAVPAGEGGETVALTLDELEAMRLVDYLGLYQEEAAGRMGVSRQTLGNTLADARRKTVGCLLNGTVLEIGGGRVTLPPEHFHCPSCHHRWQEAAGAAAGREVPPCPACRQQRTLPESPAEAGEQPIPGRRHCCRQSRRPAGDDPTRT